MQVRCLLFCYWVGFVWILKYGEIVFEFENSSSISFPFLLISDLPETFPLCVFIIDIVKSFF